MTKLHRPLGLIRYSSEKELRGDTRRVMRPRVLIYLAVLLALVGFLALFIAHREVLTARVMSATIPPTAFTLPDGRAGWRVPVPLHIRNPIGEPAFIELSLEPAGGTLRTAMTTVTLPAGETYDQTVFVEYPQTTRGPVTLVVAAADRPTVRLPVPWHPPRAGPPSPINTATETIQ